MNRYGILTERELTTGWVTCSAGLMERQIKDLREPVLLEVKKLTTTFQRRLRQLSTVVNKPSEGSLQTADQQRLAPLLRASAAYYVAQYQREGLPRGRRGSNWVRGPGGLDGWIQTGFKELAGGGQEEELQLLSFGWLLYEDLLAARAHKRAAGAEAAAGARAEAAS